MKQGSYEYSFSINFSYQIAPHIQQQHEFVMIFFQLKHKLRSTYLSFKMPNVAKAQFCERKKSINIISCQFKLFIYNLIVFPLLILFIYSIHEL